MSSGSQLIDRIREATIGDDQATWGPFGARRLTYADTAASGRGVDMIEDFIRSEVLPHYANTHTEASGTARQTTKFREDARAIIAREVGAGPGASVIFCGSGSTAATSKVIGLLGLRVPDHMSAQLPKEHRPVVFIGPYEHHSNDIAWRETMADVVVIGENITGGIDVEDLERRLIEYKHRPLRIGSFSAGSNVTGILTDVVAITSILRRHGALSMFDFAASGSHVKIDLGEADALFISPHKFIGGVGTSGILVARNHLFQNRVPVVAGGGTVLFVSETYRDYTHHKEEKEEGGTPGIVENIRTGLVFQLKAAVGYDLILKREQRFLERALDRWGQHPNIQILGNPQARRLSIISLLITAPHSDKNPATNSRKNKLYLHHNFVVALLNDLFGIQARGGCSCAGPYGHRLLKVSPALSDKFRHVTVREGLAGIKPGWTRVSLCYTFSDAVFNYIVRAVEMIATDGWRLLPQYQFNPATGIWTHRAPVRAPLGLDTITYSGSGMMYETRTHVLDESELRRHLHDAIGIFKAAATTPDRPVPWASPTAAEIIAAATSELFEKLRWFDMPTECLRSEVPAFSSIMPISLSAWPAIATAPLTPPRSPYPPIESSRHPVECGAEANTPSNETLERQNVGFSSQKPATRQRPFALKRLRSFLAITKATRPPTPPSPPTPAGTWQHGLEWELAPQGTASYRHDS